MAAEDAPSEVPGNPDDGRTGEQSGLESKLDIVVSGSARPGSVLMMVKGRTPGRLHLLDRPETIIGRGAEAHVRIDEKAVSQRHAKITNHSGRCHLYDLDSTNGTFVNSRPVADKELRHGDSIWIGETVFAYFQEGEADSSRTIALSSAMPNQQLPARLGPASHAPGTALYDAPQEGGAGLIDVITRIIKIYEVLKRHRVLLGSAALAGMLIGAVSMVVAPPPDSAMCQVTLRPNPKENPVERAGWRPQQQGETLAFFSAAEQNFNNPELIARTLEILGVQTPPRPEVEKVRSHLELTSIPRTGDQYLSRFRLGYFDRSPYTAVDFLKAHVENYLDSEIDKGLKVFKAEATFLKQQLDSTLSELGRIESELLKFKEANLKGLPEQAQGAFSSRYELMSRKGELAAQVARLQLDLQYARQRYKAGETVVESKVEQSQPYEVALANVNQKLSEARARGLGDQHPEVKQLRKEAEEFKSLIKNKVNERVTDTDRSANAGYRQQRERTQEIEVELRAASAELGSVSKNLAEMDSVVAALPHVEARLQELNRAQESTKALHDRLFEQLKKAEVQLELERASAAARYEINIPPRPSNPARLMTAGIRLGAGVAAALLVAALIAVTKELRRFIRANADKLKPGASTAPQA